MESVGYYHSPCPSLRLPRHPRSNRRSSNLRFSPVVIPSAALFVPSPAPPAGATANAVSDFCVIAATSPAKSGDINVFLQTSAVLLGMYWVANFLVPDLISKYFGFDKVGKEDDSNKPDGM